MKKAILLVNVGTPDSPDVRDVKRFLLQFLSDRHVIHLPWLVRQLLVRLIIVPFRGAGSAASYRKLWTKNGSPIRFYMDKVREQLQERLEGRADVWAAMTYGYPDIESVMSQMQQAGYRQLTVVPLFPQYADSTTGSVEEHIHKQIARWPRQPELTIVRQFDDLPLFIDAWHERIKAYQPGQYQHILFSFHGLPLSHLPKTCRKNPHCECTQQQVTTNCYKAACYETARKIASSLGFTNERYTVTFQSRLSKRWMQPFTDDVLEKLASEGKSVLVVAPSFVADCLETCVELGIEYKELFLAKGGSGYNWVESLNDQPKWIAALEQLIINN